MIPQSKPTKRSRKPRLDVIGYGLRKLDEHGLPLYLEHYGELGQHEWTSIQEAQLFFPSPLSARSFMTGAGWGDVEVVRYSRNSSEEWCDGPADEEVVGGK